MRAFVFVCLIILILFLILLAHHTTMTMKLFKLMFHKGLLATHTMKFLKLKLFTLLASLTGRSYYICMRVDVLSHLGVAVFPALFITLNLPFSKPSRGYRVYGSKPIDDRFYSCLNV